MSDVVGDRKDELAALKRIDLSVIASAFGFEVDPQESTRRTTMMRSARDKIGISRKNGEYVFVSNRNKGVGGSAIDFAQQVISPGCNLGEARRLLRPFLKSSHYTSVHKRNAGKSAPDIKRSADYDFDAVAKRVSSFKPIEGHHPYLCDERSMPADLLKHPRVRGKVLYSPRQMSLIFPHYGPPATDPTSTDRCINGYEIKANKINLFSSGGRKTLWSSSAYKQDRILAVCESGLDALSYLALHGADETRVVSVSGNINALQPELLKSAIGRMGQGATIVAAFDADAAGDRLTETLQQIVSQSGRVDLVFRDHRPQPGLDWNDVLQQKFPPQSLTKSANLSYRM